MKKYLSFVALLLLFSCSKETHLKDAGVLDQSENKPMSISEAMGRIKSSSLTAIQSLGAGGKITTVDLKLLNNGCLRKTDISGVSIFRTHGYAPVQKPFYEDDRKIIAMYTSNDGVVTGSGVGVQYPFKYGAIYTIKISVNNEGLEVNGDKVQSVKRRPSLAAKLTNAANISQTNCEKEAPEYLLGPDPVQNFASSTSNNSYDSHSITFTPSQCYNFLVLSALPNLSGRSEGVVNILDVEIIETNALGIIGPGILNANQESPYTVEYNGFPINSNFNWMVTGDLQIIGNAVGPNVVIKASSLKGGTIVASLNGCNILSKVIENTEMVLPHVQTYGPMYGGSPYNYSVSNVPNATSFTWEVGPGGQILSGQGDRTVVIIFDQISENTYDRDVSISVTAHGPFGSSPRATSYQTIRGCNSCPIQ